MFDRKHIDTAYGMSHAELCNVAESSGPLAPDLIFRRGISPENNHMAVSAISEIRFKLADISLFCRSALKKLADGIKGFVFYQALKSKMPVIICISVAAPLSHCGYKAKVAAGQADEAGYKARTVHAGIFSVQAVGHDQTFLMVLCGS